MGHYIGPDIGIKVSYLQLCLFDDLLYLGIVGFVKEDMRFMFVFSCVEISSLAILQRLLIHLASSQVHLLNDVFFEHERVNLPLEIIVSLVCCALQYLHCQLPYHTSTM